MKPLVTYLRLRTENRMSFENPMNINRAPSPADKEDGDSNEGDKNKSLESEKNPTFQASPINNWAELPSDFYVSDWVKENCKLAQTSDGAKTIELVRISKLRTTSEVQNEIAARGYEFVATNYVLGLGTSKDEGLKGRTLISLDSKNRFNMQLGNSQGFVYVDVSGKDIMQGTENGEWDDHWDFVVTKTQEKQ
jgi:hypothetical protein